MGMIQIRHVPEEVHRTLKSRAAMRGQSLSEYLLTEVTQWATAPTPEELDDRIRARGRSGVATQEIVAARNEGRRG